MHEMSLIQSMLQIVAEERARHGLGRVTKVTLSNGALAGAVTDALYFGWEALTPGTECEGAELVINEVPLEVVCGSCGARFAPESHRAMPCPECDEVLGHQVVAGKELRIENIEAEDAGADPAPSADAG